MGGIPRMLAIMVSIIITVIGLAFLASYITGAFSGAKASQATSELSTVISNTQGLYANQPTFAGLNETVAVQGGVFPSNMVILSTNTAYDPWNGAVKVAAASTATQSTPTEFTVEFDGVPVHACDKLAISYNSSNLVSLTINGNSITIPPTISEVVSSSGGCAVGSNILIWTLN